MQLGPNSMKYLLCIHIPRVIVVVLLIMENLFLYQLLLITFLGCVNLENFTLENLN